MTIVTYFVWFMFYSMVGWVYEATGRSIKHKKFINTGFLNGPYCPIYGAGVMLMVILLSDIDNVFLLFMASGTLACILEYITSFALEKIFHMRWWDYSKMFMNLHGRICLLGFLGFGIMGSIVVKIVHPIVAGVTAQIPDFVLITIAIILLVILLTDFIYTIIRLTKLNVKLKKFTNDFDEYFKQSRKQSEEFSEKLRADIQERYNKSQAKTSKRLNLVEKHILRDYPKLRSTRYNEALKNLRNQFKASRTKSNSTSKSKSDTKSKKAKSRD